MPSQYCYGIFSSILFLILDCGSLTSPENGSVRYSTGTTYQSVASFNCSTGYTISTNSTRTCKADKTWSNVTPYCTIKGKFICNKYCQFLLRYYFNFGMLMES